MKNFFPPLLWNEKREDYDVLFDAIAMTLQPQDIIQWLHVKEAADISWELQRERRIKAEIIMSAALACSARSGFIATHCSTVRHSAAAVLMRHSVDEVEIDVRFARGAKTPYPRIGSLTALDPARTQSVATYSPPT